MYLLYICVVISYCPFMHYVCSCVYCVCCSCCWLCRVCLSVYTHICMYMLLLCYCVVCAFWVWFGGRVILQLVVVCLIVIVMCVYVCFLIYCCSGAVWVSWPLCMCVL